MKRVVFAGLFAALLSGCGDKTTPTTKVVARPPEGASDKAVPAGGAADKSGGKSGGKMSSVQNPND